MHSTMLSTWYLKCSLSIFFVLCSLLHVLF